MRFFIALEVPEESRQQLSEVQNRLKQIIPTTRLINPEKLHLTIAFVGEQPESLAHKLKEVLTTSTADINPFSVTPAYIDGFPTLHTAHILWAGVKGDTDKLFILRERIKDELVTLNLDVDERRFIPHIALAKVKNFYLRRDEEKLLEQMMAKKFQPINVNSIKLFESILEQGLHHHNTLAEIKLV